ncbi:MAG TPA: glycoside hydrolase family 9 protein [Terriglobales bacterium]|nr:glycoside hydrolase family 9 protein [Terriglobales bacterium]
MRNLLALFFAFTAITVHAADTTVLTNHVGYEPGGPKHAVILSHPGESVSSCALKTYPAGQLAATFPAKAAGPVKKWRDWYFWTIVFDSFTAEGEYYLDCKLNSGAARSFPFAIQQLILERNTLSDAIYYFKEERSSGRLDEADRHLHFDGSKQGVVDAHGGWWDATGDYGKHFSHLSFSTYFNPQQIPFTVYSLFKTKELLGQSGITEFARYDERLLDEAMFGADYLVRMKAPDGSFYRSVTNGGVKQVPEERKIAGEMKKFGIYQTSSQEPRDMVEQANNDLEYEVSYRSGGGMAIAALAIASTYPTSGEFKNADYLKAAEDAFAYLETSNLKMLNDGKENILDDYCALTAATELFRATKKDEYKAAADRRATNLMSRLISGGPYHDYWRADDKDRPFFHASDAGLPVVSLLYYSEITDAKTRGQVLDTVKKSLISQLALDDEVVNPFEYARQIVQDKAGARRTSFFFPHSSDAAPWWQGDNARLASLAAAARLARPHYTGDPKFQHQLESFASSQLNWILGLNPFDSSMMYGVGRNNPQYMFFDSWEFTNAPGGISNGITSGFRDEDDIDYNLTYKQTGADNDWRWQEQWLPHTSWYMLAVAAHAAKTR